MSMQSPMGMIPMGNEPTVTAAVMPVRFWIKYKEMPDNTLRAEEWVEYAKKGVTIPATVPNRIDRLKKAAEKAAEPDDEAAALWRAIKPYYDNWKAGGTDEVTSGTPLSIWPGVTRDIVEALKPFKIYSVEDLSIATDVALQRVPDPNIMRYRDRAKKFLATKDLAVAVRDSDESKAEAAALRAEMDQLKKMLADAMKSKGEAEAELDAATPAVARKRRTNAGQPAAA